MISEDKWFEFWYSEGEDVLPTYTLAITPDPNKSGDILVLDPQKNYLEVFRGKNYDEARYYVTEDDYELMEGRMFPDDGWPEPGSPGFRSK